MTLPSIIITKIDADRLERLLDTIPDSQFPGKDLLERELDRAKIVDSSQVPPDVVTMNSDVRFRIPDSGREFALKLVYPADADGSPDKVSITAPIGSALLGLREGDRITWPMPGGAVTEVELIAVTYQPERDGGPGR